MPRIALIGNPNVGKTVVFNALTGAKQHVGNWPGVTVERREGRFRHRGLDISVIDLPGIYTLSPFSLDEKISRDYIVDERPDAVVDIVDASNLERNLYLTLQLLETGANVVVGLNMMDEAEKKGMKIDVERLSEILKAPVVPMSAINGEGIDELKDAIYEEITGHEHHRHMAVGYGEEVERYIVELEEDISKCKGLRDYRSRWLAVGLLEGDGDIICKVRKAGCEDVIERSEAMRSELSKKTGEMMDIYFADRRYEFIEEIVSMVMVRGKEKWTFSDMLDNVFTNPVFGIPSFFLLMWAAFEFTFAVAEPFMNMIDIGFTWLADVTRASISNPALASLLADGIISGVGSVLIFLPNIFLLFFALSLLEDSGYLSRAAFVMDKSMYKIGLPGKSFVPMLLGFGCNVPAIMSTRTIEDRNDRLITILINPLMSCSARLPVYLLFAGAFFAGNEGAVVFSMYLMGILLAVIMALLLRRFLVKGRPAPLIMEMPPYRMPTLKNSLMKMWENGYLFIKKAGTVIVFGVTIVWFLSTYTYSPDAPHGIVMSSDIENSFAAYLGQWLQPIFAPMGWDWKAVMALLFGFISKEIVVGTFGTLYGVEGGGEGLQNALMGSFTPVSAYAYMAFVLIYVPCLATIATIKAETGSWKWPLLAIAYMMGLAYLVALIISLLGNALMGVFG